MYIFNDSGQFLLTTKNVFIHFETEIIKMEISIPHVAFY